MHNYNDVPGIGNCTLYNNKDIKEDKYFKLIIKNVNEFKKLWVSIHPIERNSQYLAANNRIKHNSYLYEFIATSNSFYYIGKDKIAFFGLKENKKGEYSAKKISEINKLPCSTEADSIWQLSDKYICIGLKHINIYEPIGGLAIIDIHKRQLFNIIKSHAISCVFFNPKNNLLFASMEVGNPIKNFFITKIYKIKNYKDGKKDDDIIDIEEIYEHKNKQTDIITSIQQINASYFKINFGNENIPNNIIFVTSSNDSTLEIVKTNLWLSN